jgi:phi LC3 family holin
MPEINWRVRFNKKNLSFVLRFILALFIPVLGYLGLRFEDLTTWSSLWDVVLQFVSNPFLVGLTIANALNMVPDPVVKGLSDSKMALKYYEPKSNARDSDYIG